MRCDMIGQKICHVVLVKNTIIVSTYILDWLQFFMLSILRSMILDGEVIHADE